MRSVLAAMLAGVLASGMSACAAGTDVEGGDQSAQALSARCDAVRCPMPLCAEGQHLSYRGGTCCPQCVDNHPDHCAATLCPMVMCIESDIQVTNPGQCCPRCVHAPAAVECSNDQDCPQLQCFACPCPVTTCQGHQCVAQTPSESTCGAL